MDVKNFYIALDKVTMALLDSKFVQILLILLAVYMVSQIFMKDGFQEHLDTVVTVTDPQGNPPVVDVTQPPAALSASISVDRPTTNEAVIQVHDTGSGFTSGSPAAAEAGTLSGGELAGALLSPENASAEGVVTSAPSAALPPPKAPAPLTAVSEEILAKAPAASTTEPVGAQLYAPEPDVDYNAVFDRKGLEPADLLPPKGPETELYAGIAPDPRLANNFLSNTWSQGIIVEKNSNRQINDLRGVYPIPQTVTSPFMQSTRLPDIQRKSIAELV